VSQWRADLVEPRRRLRLFILLSGSAYTLVMAAVRLSTPHGRLTDLNASLDVAALLAIVASFATVVLRVSTTLLPEDVELPGQAQARADAWSDGLATTADPGVDGTRGAHAHAPAFATSTDSARAPSSAASPASTTSARSVTSAASAMPATSAGSGSWGPTGATASIDATSADSAGRSALAIHDASAARGTTTPSRRGASPPDPEQDQLAQALARAMSERHVYRQEDLSVASLAAQLGVAEYRLRRLINQRLGHRNFNAYVNGLRLDQARAALADPAQRQLPVLTIALDAGFGSIGPFNRAFKAATGLTPTDYRRQRLDDVASSAGLPSGPAGPITPAAAARNPGDHT
jgi:AraC-like DNA-binding protein